MPKQMVQHTNQCYIALETDESHKNWIIITVIDNLVKGAAGQAIQNMNLMFGLERTEWLEITFSLCSFSFALIATPSIKHYPN